MPKADPDTLVSQSILDRLIDNEIGTPADPPVTRAQSVRQLKASLRRDLEWLLNTRRIVMDLEPDSELAHSVYNYGLPDITSLSFSNPKDRTRLLRSLEATIRTFEPRLANVKVLPVDNPEGGLRQVLRFQVEGLMKMDPA